MTRDASGQFKAAAKGEKTYLQRYNERRIEIDHMPDGPEKEAASRACEAEHDEAVAHMLKFVPRVVLHVWDHDVIGSDDYIGTVRIPLSADMLATDLHEAAEVPNPKSYKIFKQYPDDTMGSLIVAVQVVPITTTTTTTTTTTITTLTLIDPGGLHHHHHHHHQHHRLTL